MSFKSEKQEKLSLACIKTAAQIYLPLIHIVDGFVAWC